MLRLGRLSASIFSDPCKSDCQFWNLFIEEWGWVFRARQPWARLGRETGAMQFKRAEWASRKDSIREISAPCGPLTTVYAAASIWETLHQAQGPQGKERARRPAGSFSRPCTRGGQESALHGTGVSSRTHTCPGEADGEPPRAPARPERLPEDLAGEPSGHAEQGKQLTVRVMGRQLYFYIGSLRAARDGRAPALDGTAERYHLWERRWGRLGQALRPLPGVLPAEGILAALQCHLQSNGRTEALLGEGLRSSLPWPPITSHLPRSFRRFRGSVYMLTRKIYPNSDRNASRKSLLLVECLA